MLGEKIYWYCLSAQKETLEGEPAIRAMLCLSLMLDVVLEFFLGRELLLDALELIFQFN